MDNLRGFQRDLLYVIAGFDQLSGQDVLNELESYYDSDIISSRLYSNLNELAEEGYVEKGEIDRRTNFYAITDVGRDAIRERREWEDQYVDL